MSQMKIHKTECFEGVPKVIRSRIVNAAEANITQVNTTALTYIVKSYASEEEAEHDQNGTSVTVETTAGSVSSLVFDTLQSWDVDDAGYNFAMTLPPASFPTGDLFYGVCVWVDPVSGDNFIGWKGVLYCWPTMKD